MRKTALVFSGQGAQFVGMGMDLPGRFPACARLYEQAKNVMEYDLPAICFNGPDADLTDSQHCQPAVFLTSMACLTALRALRPDLEIVAVAGLSLGEWTALHVAGTIGFEDTLKVLSARGRFMQSACLDHPGGMLSVIGLDRAALDRICARSGCSIANLNSPAQTVLSGTLAAIEAAGQEARALGAKRVVPLQVAGAFHSPLMAPVVARLETVLDDVKFAAPELPVLSNVTGLPHGTPEAIRCAMLKQVTAPVHWCQSVEWMQAAGVQRIIECGPGMVLTGLIKRIVKDMELFNIQNAGDAEQVAGALD